jgi:hypothetical protein
VPFIMPCPLRFVLAGASAIVAAWLLLSGKAPSKVRLGACGAHLRRLQPPAYAAAPPLTHSRQCRAQVTAPSAAGAPAGRHPSQWLHLLLDFFTGRYLYRTFFAQHEQAGQHCQQAPAAARGCPFMHRHAASAGGGSGGAAAGASCPGQAAAAAVAAAADLQRRELQSSSTRHGHEE